jgi:hypothetical protein
LRRVAFGLFFVTLVLTMWGEMHYLVWTHVALHTGLPDRIQDSVGALLALLASTTFITLLRVFPAPILRAVWTPAFVWAGFLFILFFLFLLGDFALFPVRLAGMFDPLALARGEAAAFVVLAIGLAAFAFRSAHGEVPIRRVEITLDRLPAAMSGFSIVQISDLHVAPDTSVPRIQRLVERVNSLAPDLIALTGDLVDGSPELLQGGIAPLSGFRARHGSFFVTGNHEYFSGGDRWIQTFRALGFRVLQNERVSIGDETHSFELAGVPDWRGGSYGAQHRPRLADVLKGLPPEREVVLLAHQPRQFPDAALLGVGLQLSGHTHGGQIWPFTWLIRIAETYIHGLHREGRSQLYVSRGTGFWGPPMRLLAPSEITHITLRAAT